MISYKPLWKTLIDRDLKKLDLLNIADISRGTLAKMGNNEAVNLKIIDKICVELGCTIDEVVEIILWDLIEIDRYNKYMEYMERKEFTTFLRIYNNVRTWKRCADREFEWWNEL